MENPFAKIAEVQQFEPSNQADPSERLREELYCTSEIKTKIAAAAAGASELSERIQQLKPGSGLSPERLAAKTVGDSLSQNTRPSAEVAQTPKEVADRMIANFDTNSSHLQHLKKCIQQGLSARRIVQDGSVKEIVAFFASPEYRAMSLEEPQKELLNKIVKGLDEGKTDEILSALRDIQQQPTKVKQILQLTADMANDRNLVASYTAGQYFSTLTIRCPNGKFGAKGLVFNTAGRVEPYASGNVDEWMNAIRLRWGQ